jgi:hypothetical protein
MPDEQRPQASPEDVLAVWQAEDGRCEACARPMDKRVARVARLDESQGWTPANLQLLCVDCKAHRLDPLQQATVLLSEAIAAQVLGQLGPEQLALAGRWLGAQLYRYGVLISSGKEWRRYWLPGVATFDLRVLAQRTVEVIAVTKLAAQPAVRVKPQERTRGLPRPDRQPVQQKATKPQSAQRSA